MIDIHTIGAGGGSIAYIDHGGAFRVGPRSAGAVPGPAAYGLGGEEPTVTDANLVLGRLDADDFLGGGMKLDAEAARRVVSGLAAKLGLGISETAEGIITVINANMANAIRSRTIQKGIDPRGFSLVAFGGAGPLQGAEVAAMLGIPEVIAPPYPGITSAMGLLTTDFKYDAVQTEFQVSGAIDLKKLNKSLADMQAGLATQFDGGPHSALRSHLLPRGRPSLCRAGLRAACSFAGRRDHARKRCRRRGRRSTRRMPPNMAARSRRARSRS